MDYRFAPEFYTRSEKCGGLGGYPGKGDSIREGVSKGQAGVVFGFSKTRDHPGIQTPVFFPGNHDLPPDGPAQKEIFQGFYPNTGNQLHPVSVHRSGGKITPLIVAPVIVLDHYVAGLMLIAGCPDPESAIYHIIPGHGLQFVMKKIIVGPDFTEIALRCVVEGRFVSVDLKAPDLCHRKDGRHNFIVSVYRNRQAVGLDKLPDQAGDIHTQAWATNPLPLACLLLGQTLRGVRDQKYQQEKGIY